MRIEGLAKGQHVTTVDLLSDLRFGERLCAIEQGHITVRGRRTPDCLIRIIGLAHLRGDLLSLFL